tara:strand:+ start:157 stop:1413 length:1257 start_codon:yes stop_codon:yes gene_type:complete
VKLKSKLLILFSIILLTFLSFIIFLEDDFFYYKAKKFYNKLPGDVKSLVLLTLNKKSYENIDNDYNVSFLPKTEFINFNYQVKNMNFDNGIFDYSPRYTYYIDISEDNLIITTQNGKFYRISNKDVLSKEKNIKKKKLKTNINFSRILDSLIIDDKLYISVARKFDKCEKLFIYASQVDSQTENLDFKVLKKFEECNTKNIAGRMQPLNFQSKKGILISTGSRGEGMDYPGNYSQDDSSIFGKTLFIDLNSLKHFTFSTGHRNAQGLFVHENKILLTEHGPKGGDELNQIFFGKNYGWPISSYGKAYFTKELKYKRSHLNYGFEEPIFSFVPSIGISELYLVPDDYNEDWKNSILITSLFGKAMYRLKFQSNNYKKILYSEKIYIGQRMRDIKYLNKDKIFLLALETEGQLGVLKKKD